MYHIVKWGWWSIVLVDTLFCLEDASSLNTVDTCCEWNNKNICLCDFNPSISICKHHKHNATPQDLSLSIYHNNLNHSKYLFRHIQKKHLCTYKIIFYPIKHVFIDMKTPVNFVCVQKTTVNRCICKFRDDEQLKN